MTALIELEDAAKAVLEKDDATEDDKKEQWELLIEDAVKFNTYFEKQTEKHEKDTNTYDDNIKKSKKAFEDKMTAANKKVEAQATKDKDNKDATEKIKKLKEEAKKYEDDVAALVTK